MTDTNIERQVQQAYGSLRRPAHLDARTLAYIAEQGEAERGAPVLLAQSGGEQAQGRGKSAQARRPFKAFALKAVAACLVVALVGFAGVGAYSVPVAYAEVSSNGSVELCVNAFDRVVRVECQDDAGTAALEELKAKGVDLTGKSYEEAVGILAASGLCPDDGSVVQVTVACHDGNRGERMEQQASACFGERNHACEQVSVEEHDAAHEAGVGMHAYGKNNGSGQGQGQGQNGAGAHNGSGNGQQNGGNCDNAGTGSGQHEENEEDSHHD